MTAETTKALSQHLFRCTNINNRFVQYGYVHIKEKFTPLLEAASIEEELARNHASTSSSRNSTST